MNPKKYEDKNLSQEKYAEILGPHPSELDDWEPEDVLFDDDDFDSDVPVEMDTSFSHDHWAFVPQ